MFSSQSDRGRRRSRRERYDDGVSDDYDEPKLSRSRSRGPSTRGGKLVKKQTVVIESRADDDNDDDEAYALARTRGRSSDSAYAVGRPTYVQRRSSYSVSPPPSYRRRDSSRSSTRRGRSESRRRGFMDLDTKDGDQWKHALEAGARAAAIQAFRLRKEPGQWKDKPKLGRIATAALGAAAIEVLLEKRADDPEKHKSRRLWESSIGGLLVSRAVHGPRRDLRYQYE
jgi:hypothetical protein